MSLNIKSYFPTQQVLAKGPELRVRPIEGGQGEGNIFDPKQEAYKPPKKKIAKARDKLNIIK